MNVSTVFKKVTFQTLVVGVIVMIAQAALAGNCPIGGIVSDGNCSQRISDTCGSLYTIVGQAAYLCKNGAVSTASVDGTYRYTCVNTNTACTRSAS